MLGINQTKQLNALQKLSSGLRINQAADDSVGLAICEKMRAQIRGLAQASRNIQDGVSLIKIADDVLSEIANMAHRIRELAVQAANYTNQKLDRGAIQLEINQLITEINDTAAKAQFNGINLFGSSKIGEIIYDIQNYWNA